MSHPEFDVSAAAAEIHSWIITAYPGRAVDPAAEQRSHEILKLKRKLAVEFGRIHGWKRTKCFSTDSLRRRAGRKRQDYVFEIDEVYLDHPYFYQANRRAAAIAAHLYYVPTDIEQWAAARGLVVTFPHYFPSWHYPGATTLVLYQPKPAARGVGHARR